MSHPILYYMPYETSFALTSHKIGSSYPLCAQKLQFKLLCIM